MGNMVDSVSKHVEAIFKPQTTVLDTSELSSIIRTTVKEEVHEELVRIEALIEDLKMLTVSSLSDRGF